MDIHAREQEIALTKMKGVLVDRIWKEPLQYAAEIVDRALVNKGKLEQYVALEKLTISQQLFICGLFGQLLAEAASALMTVVTTHTETIKIVTQTQAVQLCVPVAHLPYGERLPITDVLGAFVIRDVRDPFLEKGIQKISEWNTENQTQGRECLSPNELEAVFDLLSYTISGTIYSFFEVIDEKGDDVRLLIQKDGAWYDMFEASEKMGSEIVVSWEDGWIPKFSKLGRCVL